MTDRYYHPYLFVSISVGHVDVYFQILYIFQWAGSFTERMTAFLKQNTIYLNSTTSPRSVYSIARSLSILG